MEEKRSTVRGAITFSESEKITIIEEYLNGDLSKAQIWRKYPPVPAMPSLVVASATT